MYISGKIRRVLGAGGGVLILFLLFRFLLPALQQGSLPCRFYYVLTDSMEPVIQTDSLVLTRAYDAGTPLEKGDIITFSATRFGEPIVVTHRFSHTETNAAGELVYRTHPEQSNRLDPYETRHSDILGVYWFHIPYVGKWLRFAQSGFGLLWLAQIFGIFWVQEWLVRRTEKDTR